jgi:hypothetical protein
MHCVNRTKSFLMLNAVVFVGTTLSENVNLFVRFGRRKHVTFGCCVRIGTLNVFVVRTSS